MEEKLVDGQEKKVSRREVIKAGGVVALGLAYSKPFVETVSAKQAFQNYPPTPEPTSRANIPSQHLSRLPSQRLSQHLHRVTVNGISQVSILKQIVIMGYS